MSDDLAKRSGLCKRCGVPLDDHDGLIIDRPKCRKVAA